MKMLYVNQKSIYIMETMNSDLVDLLSQNIFWLTSYPLNYIQSLTSENTSLKEEVDYLRESNKNLRKKSYEYKDELDNSKKRKRDEEELKIKIKVHKFRRCNESFNEKKIQEMISNIKNLEDMEDINKFYKNVRHNELLLKICYLNIPLSKINKMVGLSNIKKDIFKKIIYYIKNPNNEEYLHTVISGPPGVGKTELAKIYGEIFSKLGILKNSKFIQIKRDDLIAQYLGQTSHRTKKLLEDAMGGVLFLDEAYSLGNDDRKDSYAKESIDMINQYLSEQKNNFMMIIAGYENELDKCFFSVNPGLKRRFSNFLNINGYSYEELVKIFKSKVKDVNYELDINEGKLNDFFKVNKLKFTNYAGDIEKLINEMKYCQSFRTFTKNITCNKMTADDLVNGLKIFKEEDRSFLNNLYI